MQEVAIVAYDDYQLLCFWRLCSRLEYDQFSEGRRYNATLSPSALAQAAEPIGRWRERGCSWCAHRLTDREAVAEEPG